MHGLLLLFGQSKPSARGAGGKHSPWRKGKTATHLVSKIDACSQII